MTAHRLLQDLLLADYDQQDPGDAGVIVPLKQFAHFSLVSGGAETRTLLDPIKVGIEITLSFKTDGGNCVVTAASAVNVAGNTIMTFADEGETAVLKSIDDGGSLRWQHISDDTDGPALSGP